MARRPEEIAGVKDVSLDGETILVTGSTRGIGRAAALALGRLGARVFVHGRDPERGRQVVDQLAALDCPTGTFIEADFADHYAVVALADRVRSHTDSLDALLNNAGLYQRSPGVTDEGIEYTFAVNHLATFVLTCELCDVIRASDRARVVTTASAAHQGATIDFDRLVPDEPVAGWTAYCQSKLANILFTRELGRRYPDIDATAFHPGFVPGSGFLRGLPGPLAWLGRTFGSLPFVGTSPQAGAATAVYLAASPDVEGVSGAYYSDCERQMPSPTARDDDVAEALWTESLALTGRSP